MCHQCNSHQNNHIQHSNTGSKHLSFVMPFCSESNDGLGLIKRGVYEPILDEENSHEPFNDKALAKYEEERKNDRKNNEIVFSRLAMQRELVRDMKSERIENRSISLSQCFLYPAVARDKDPSSGYEPDWALIVRDRIGKTHFERVAKCNCGDCCYCGVIKALKSESELLALINKAVEEDLGIFMLTFNARHYKNDNPVDVLAWVKEATRLTMKDNRVKRLLEKMLGKVDGMGVYNRNKRPAIGCFTALEVPYGKNGFHPHFHKLLITNRKASKEDIKTIRNRIWEVYNGYFEKLSGRKLSKQTGVHFQALKGENAKEKAAKYFVKNGLVKELTGYANKNALDDNEIGLFSDDFVTTLKAKELKDVKSMVDKLVSESSITHLGMIDLCIYFKKMAKIDEFREYALEQFNYWKSVYCQYISTLYGTQKYRFSNGLKSWAGLPEDGDDEEIEEESDDTLRVAEFSVSIDERPFSFITKNRQEANLLYIASFPDIKSLDMTLIVQKLDEIARSDFIRKDEKPKVLEDYFALLICEKRLVDFDLNRYIDFDGMRDKRAAEEMPVRMAVARKFVLDRGKKKHARPVFYKYRGKDWFIPEFVKEFNAEIRTVVSELGGNYGDIVPN